MEEKLRFTIMQNNEIYKSITQSSSYEEFIELSGNEKVNGYKNATFKEKRFKESLTKLVARFS